MEENIDRQYPEHKEEPAFRKSPWRFVFLALAVLSGGYLLLYSIMLRFGMLLNTLTLFPNESGSIGIIGGADGPTAIFVSGTMVQHQGFDWEIAFIAVILIISILSFLRLRKCRKK